MKNTAVLEIRLNNQDLLFMGKVVINLVYVKVLMGSSFRLLTGFSFKLLSGYVLKGCKLEN
jgi:nitrate/nitrite transporter NarK